MKLCVIPQLREDVYVYQLYRIDWTSLPRSLVLHIILLQIKFKVRFYGNNTQAI